MSDAIVKREEAGELAPRSADRIAAMMEQMIANGITKDNAEAMASLSQTFREMRADDAKMAFNRAFVALRNEVKAVQATRSVPNNDGGTRYKFAPLEEIMEQVGPRLTKYGFSDTYTQRAEGNSLVVTCTLIHVEGHERSNDVSIAVSGPPKSTASQASGSTTTYGRRYALTLMLGLVIAPDTDARNLGEQIDPEEADDLERRVRAVCAGDANQVNRFLRLGGAATFPEIRRSKCDVVLQLLEQMERNPPVAVAPKPAAKPFPASFDDAGAWRSAMLAEMTERWNCDTSVAVKSFDRILVKAGAQSYLAMEPARRKGAWEALTTGGLDSYRPGEKQ